MELDVCLYPGVVTRKQNICVMSYLSRQKHPQHKIISHLIASQIIKNFTLKFFIDIIHYILFSYKLLVTMYSPKYPE